MEFFFNSQSKTESFFYLLDIAHPSFINRKVLFAFESQTERYEFLKVTSDCIYPLNERSWVFDITLVRLVPLDQRFVL